MENNKEVFRAHEPESLSCAPITRDQTDDSYYTRIVLASVHTTG